MLIIFTVVLFNNEGNSVNRAKALKNIADATEINSTDVSDTYDGQLVLFSGTPTVESQLTDETFGVTADPNTIKFDRTVKMYQWKETSQKEGDKTTYDYEMEWSNQLIDSTKFNTPTGHENPTVMKYESKNLAVDDIVIGNYHLGNDFIKQINQFEPYEAIEFDASTADHMTVENNVIYISANGSSDMFTPQVGDYTIQYDFVPATLLTVLGQKKGTSLIAYSTKTGNLAEVSYGEKDKIVFMNEKMDANSAKTWGIRIGSLVALMIAIGLVFSPLTNLIGKIPFLGNIVNGGITLIAVAIGGGWGVLVIAFGWLFFKPILAIGLIGGVIAMLILLSKKNKQAESKQGTESINAMG
jgi:hypothetical protein